MGRKMINGRSPSFFKVLIGDFATRLSIPPAFLKNFNGNLPNISILKSNVEEKSWCMVMEKNNQGFFFSCGWSKFVKDHGLEDGDFLLFWFIGNSTFDVRIYGRTACEKNIGFACKGRTIRSNKFNKSQVSCNVSCATLKRKSSHKIKVESEQKEVAEAVDFIKPNHPYCLKVLKSYQRHNIILPVGFARQAGLIYKKSTVVKDPQGNVWSIGVHKSKQGHVFLSTGWVNFWVAKGLAAGDKCLFKFIEGTGNVLHVQIFSKGASSSGSGPHEPIEVE